MTQEERLAGMRREVSQLRADERAAWVAVCFHRALLWDYHVFRVHFLSFQQKAAKGVIPSEKFTKQLRALYGKVWSRVRALPEYERYRDIQLRRKEAEGLLLYTLTRLGAEGDDDSSEEKEK